MKNRENIFVNIVSNVIIVVIIISVCVFAFSDNVTSVFERQEQPYYNGNRDNKNVSLMFNVYQNTEQVEQILEILANNDVKATFFVGGCWVAKNQDTLKKIADSGCEIGNHGYWHKTHSKLNHDQNVDEILITHKLVESYSGVGMTLFAPPSGDYNDLTIQVAHKLGYKTIMWSKDTIDWRDQDVSLLIKRATNKPQNGDLILMHPTKATVKALQAIIDFYKNNGYNITTVSNNIT